jgi:PAS domain S-box-containing protein
VVADDLGTPAIVMADADGVIRHWSGGAERLFGYSSAEAEGQSLDLIVPEEYRQRHWEGFRNAMSAGASKLDRAATNLPVQCRDGAVRVFPARFVFLVDARSHVVGAMGIYSAADGSERPFGPVSGS